MVTTMVKTPDWPADRLKALIDRIQDETGLNKAQLAGMAGINPSQLSRWTSGATRPQHKSMVDLGEALKARFPGLGVDGRALAAAAGYDFESPAAPPDMPEQTSREEANAIGVSVIERIMAAQDKRIEIILQRQAEEQRQRDEAMKARLDEQSEKLSEATAKITSLEDYIRRMGGEGSSDQDIA